ncbi:short-chain dehydrogenase reductase 2a-like [Nicotiana tabacum]|uniref:Short-chain dehydrogenase reductase 2a-like n=3 Tax=Nicotiana tabacum TaxID=4097 RepID=A0AC58U6G6_TOBAC|nr:PREDICTED: 2-(R)-hydroxypropyl-CoM dehydrogenase-like [Nicotiana tabacum]
MVTGRPQELGESCVSTWRKPAAASLLLLVVLTGSNLSTTRSIYRAPPRAFAMELDITADGATIKAPVQIAWDAFGGIDALVNNAGVRGSVSSSVDFSEDERNHTFNTNLRGAWLVSKYVCRRMRDAKQGGGSVISTSSAAALNRVVYPGSLAYTSSNMALDMLTKRK